MDAELTACTTALRVARAGGLTAGRATQPGARVTTGNVEEAVDAVIRNADLQAACFPEGTAVLIENGQLWVDKKVRPIEFIEVGDKVLSRCEITGEMAYKRVTKIFERDYGKVASIHCTFSSAHYAMFGSADYPILATEEHPFWVQGKGWREVRDLQTGDEFLTSSGEQATVRKVRFDTFNENVFNLEVEDFHTYFVSSAGVWVHNCNRKTELDSFNSHLAR